MLTGSCTGLHDSPPTGARVLQGYDKGVPTRLGSIEGKGTSLKGLSHLQVTIQESTYTKTTALGYPTIPSFMQANEAEISHPIVYVWMLSASALRHS